MEIQGVKILLQMQRGLAKLPRSEHAPKFKKKRVLTRAYLSIILVPYLHLDALQLEL